MNKLTYERLKQICLERNMTEIEFEIAIDSLEKRGFLFFSADAVELTKKGRELLQANDIQDLLGISTSNDKSLN